MSTARVLKLEIHCGNHNIVSNPKLKGCLHEGRKILVLGRSQRADHPSALMMCFLYSDYTQRVVLVPSTRIFLAERQEDPSIAPCKLLSLGRSQYQGQTRQKCRRVVHWLITAIKADHFVWSNPRADYCVNSAERQ